MIDITCCNRRLPCSYSLLQNQLCFGSVETNKNAENDFCRQVTFLHFMVKVKKIYTTKKKNDNYKGIRTTGLPRRSHVLLIILSK